VIIKQFLIFFTTEYPFLGGVDPTE